MWDELITDGAGSFGNKGKERKDVGLPFTEIDYYEQLEFNSLN